MFAIKSLNHFWRPLFRTVVSVEIILLVFRIVCWLFHIIKPSIDWIILFNVCVTTRFLNQNNCVKLICSFLFFSFLVKAILIILFPKKRGKKKICWSGLHKGNTKISHSSRLTIELLEENTKFLNDGTPLNKIIQLISVMRPSWWIINGLKNDKTNNNKFKI